MIVKVLMLAFGQPGEIREVDIPETELVEDTLNENILNLTFHYGQNEFQSQKHPSVSVGDVIELGGQHYLVMPVGFSLLSDTQLQEYTALERRNRGLYVFDQV